MSIYKENNINKKINRINFKEINYDFLIDSDNSQTLVDNKERDLLKYHILIHFDVIKDCDLTKDLISFLFDELNPDESISVKIQDNTYMLKKRLYYKEIKEILKSIKKLFNQYGNDIEQDISILYFPHGKTIRSKSD